jgi:hypothetical protein
MDMKADLIFNHTNSKFFVKITKTKGFKNSKTLSQDQTRESIKNKKTIRTRTEGSCWNQELNNTGLYQCWTDIRNRNKPYSCSVDS